MTDLSWQCLINDIRIELSQNRKELNELRRAIRPLLLREKRAKEHQQCEQLGGYEK